MQFVRNYGSKCTVKALNESESALFQVKFLTISANSTKVCDICCARNFVSYALFPPGPSIVNVTYRKRDKQIKQKANNF